MTSNFKTLGLTLVAFLALGALMASAASAQKFTSDGPVTLTGTETGAETANAFTSFGSSVRCPGSTYTGHEFNTTPHKQVPFGATTATITPLYVNCKSTALNLPTTVDMNGCDYVMHLVANIFGNISIKTTIVCPPSSRIMITAKSGGSTICTTTITESAEGYEGFVASNGAGGHINITGTIKGIEAHRSGSFCVTETTKTGELHLDITVKGHNSEGGATSISVS